MSRHKKGIRVFVVFDSDGSRARVLGSGVYEGDFLPDEEALGWAAFAREAGVPNPRIRLDNGDVVWGGECWWGPEDAGRARYQDVPQVEVRIADLRREALERTGVVNPSVGEDR